jgi:pimeloyl-ACP methyl ester carboxylesterase
MRRRTTSPHLHRLLRYIPERVQHRGRWEAALERSSVRMHFVWGMQDPVSGVGTAERIRARLKAADFVVLEDVGHYPHLEVPERVLGVLGAVL